MKSHTEAIYKTIQALVGSSASRVCLLAVVFTLCILAIVVVIANIHDPQIVLGVKEQWGSVALLVVGFYFGQKGLPAADRENVKTVETTVIQKTTPTTPNDSPTDASN